MRKQCLDVFPHPLRSIAHDTESHFFFRNHARFLDLFEGLAELRLILHLMPTQQMDDAITIDQIKTEALGVAPLTLPQRASGPLASLTRPAPPRMLRSCRHIGPINAQDQHRTAKATR